MTDPTGQRTTGSNPHRRLSNLIGATSGAARKGGYDQGFRDAQHQARQRRLASAVAAAIAAVVYDLIQLRRRTTGRR